MDVRDLPVGNLLFPLVRDVVPLLLLEIRQRQDHTCKHYEQQFRNRAESTRADEKVIARQEQGFPEVVLEPHLLPDVNIQLR